MSKSSDKVHMKVRSARSSDFAEFMDEVYRAMPEDVRKSLPSNVGEYVNAITAYALDNLPQFEVSLARAIAGNYAENRIGERFILDPKRTDSISESCLYLDSDGQIVTVKNPKLGELGNLMIKSYQSYEVLTGPLKGQRFGRIDRPLPSKPIFQRIGSSTEENAGITTTDVDIEKQKQRIPMKSLKPEISGTAHILPFDKLSPSDFERMCFWLIQREGFRDVEHLGAAGSEQGRDISAKRQEENWIFQCKRVKNFRYADAKKEIDKLQEIGFPPVYVFMVTTKVSAKVREKIRNDYLDMEIHFWAETELDEMVKRHPDVIAEFFQLPGREPGYRADIEYQEFIGSVEKWRSNKAEEEDLQKIANVMQSGGVNLGEGNQIEVRGDVIGTINISTGTLEQSQEIINQLFKDREVTEKSPTNKLLIRRKINAFLCHAADDKPIVRQLYNSLLSDNVDPWLDEEDLIGGQKWKV